MTEGVLEKVILSFYRQEFNVLLCTTIIENGIDIPTANTIIIHRADQFGLAQLHQLRGRVGRSRHRAYAYLLIPHPDALKEDARKRLEAIENFDDLGAGFMLATQDLEIRGAGNLLGAQQSGQIREVGFDLYTQMLQEAIQQLREQGEAMSDGVPAAAGADQDPPPAIQLHISTYIPEAYIADVQQRLTVYKRIAGAVTGEEIDAMKQELADRFGPLPPPVGHLLQLVEIRQQCQHLRIVRLEAGPVGGVVQFHATPRVDPGAVATLLQTGQGRYVFDAAKNTLALRQRSWQEEAQRIAEIRLLLAVLGGQVRPQELIAGGRGA
jgi:transcription-repair coupling factor (superfamily II helicase)